MKQLLFTCLCSMIIHAATAQGLTKNGQITSTGSSYVNKNGTVGGTTGVNKNGHIVTAQSLPIVTTTAISSIAAGSATGGGNVTSTGGLTITSGICWNTATNPTIANNITAITPGAVGSFNSNLTSLIPNTTYYVRAYATNTLGTTYGDNVSFTTIALVIGSSYQGGNVFALTTDGNNVITGGWVFYYRGKFTRDNALVQGQGGYNDWELPTSGQLVTICGIKSTLGIGSPRNGYNYWTSNATSTIGNSPYRYGDYVSFSNCSYVQQGATTENTSTYVMLVRDFTITQ